MTAEEQDIVVDKLAKLCSEERLVDKNGWQHYVYKADECTLHATYVRATGIELYQNDVATKTNRGSSCS